VYSHDAGINTYAFALHLHHANARSVQGLDLAFYLNLTTSSMRLSALDTPGISTPRIASVLRNAATMIHGT
jgi:hypothetical protein